MTNNTRAIRYLSLAAKAGQISVGMQEVLQEISKKRGCLIVAASDAGDNTIRKAKTASLSGNIRFLHSPYTKSEISDAIGRGRDVSLVLIRDQNLAEAFESANAKEWEEQ